MFAKHAMRVIDGLIEIGFVADATSVTKTLGALNLLPTLRGKVFGANSTFLLIVDCSHFQKRLFLQKQRQT